MALPLRRRRQQLPLNAVWFKRDVRVSDHGPYAEGGRSQYFILLLYLYEPSQLCEPTVQGTHVAIVNEGLVDRDLAIWCVERIGTSLQGN